MSGIARLGDTGTGHEAYPSHSIITSSSNVFVNGIGVATVGDTLESHCDEDGCHEGTLASGSSTVYANSKAICRIGDSVSCGGTISSGSTDVFSS